MSAILSVKRSLLDLARLGPGFFVGGIRSNISRAETLTVKTSSKGSVVLRPGQSDFLTLRQVLRDEEYRLPRPIAERVEREARRLRDGGSVPVVVDAGANIGAASIWFRSVFPETAIVAIEPDTGNAAIARRNVAALEDVTLLEAAIGAEPGFVAVIEADKGWATKTERADRGCPIVTVDQAVATIPSGKLLVAKIDIEGFESDLFERNLGWLDDVLVVYIEPHDWMFPGKGTSRSFQKAFGERNFELHLQGENLIYVRRE